ncbi:PREDICTED: uncharacterized protein LOC105140420 isoform X1 [Populus euphratica]|uniref:Uncharacterized protein LOC105140420 isoform X1 n=1 Tax=Populus euphratica TaxID=75702 RepID=A0AAJ6VD19_POPEU|nr:PREDICTED: uncharacterized protein LOC105140420 isoform X1 [Populus euphratica]
MEALWNLEDTWKLTSQEAVLLFVCSAFAVIALCTATMLKRKAQRKPRVNQDPSAGSSIRWSDPEPGSNDWITIKTVLMESMRWSEASKWEEGGSGSESGSGRGREMLRPPPLLGLERCDSSTEWQSRNSFSPAVWQRPILMGEKCELPRHSGLILYDERGRLLDHSLTSSRKENIHEVKPAAVLRTTKVDLL